METEFTDSEPEPYIAETSKQRLCGVKICLVISSLSFCILMAFACGLWVGHQRELFDIFYNDNDVDTPNKDNHEDTVNILGLLPPQQTTHPLNKTNNNTLNDAEIQIIEEAEILCSRKPCCREDDDLWLIFGSSIQQHSECEDKGYIECLLFENNCVWDCDEPNKVQFEINPNELIFQRHFIGINSHKAIGYDDIPRISLEEEIELASTNDLEANLSYITMDKCGTMYEYHLTEESLLREQETLHEHESTIFEERSEYSHENEVDFSSQLLPIQRRLGVIGNDDRQQIQSWQYPYYHNVYIEARTGSGVSRCSGAWISPKHVLTAGHCCSDGAGNYYWDYAIVANLNGGGKEKTFSSSNGNGVEGTFIFGQWHYNHDWQWDICILTLSISNSGFGYFAFGHSNNIDDSWVFDINGYPHDKGHALISQQATMDWVIQHKLASATADVVKGNSGGPAWHVNDLTIYGVVSHEIFLQTVDPPLNFANAFARITQPKFAAMCSYIRRSPETARWCL